MSLFVVTLHALLPLFLLIVLGYALKRARLLHSAHVPVFNGLVMNVTMPALIIKGLMGAPRLSHQSLLLPVAMIGAQMLCLALAWGLGRALQLTDPVRGALMMTGAHGNTGFLGYPMTLALLPSFFPQAILVDQFGMTIAMYIAAALLGARLGHSSGKKGAARASVGRFFRSPLFLSVVVGVGLRLLPAPAGLSHWPALRALGAALSQCLTYLGQGTTPVVLLALGVALRPGAARLHVSPLLAACMVKLVACPVAMWAACRALGLHGGLLSVGVLMAAMPTAVMASVLSAENDLAGDYAVSVVFAATVLSAATVPLLLSVLR